MPHSASVYSAMTLTLLFPPPWMPCRRRWWWRRSAGRCAAGRWSCSAFKLYFMNFQFDMDQEPVLVTVTIIKWKKRACLNQSYFFNDFLSDWPCDKKKEYFIAFPQAAPSPEIFFQAVPAPAPRGSGSWLLVKFSKIFVSPHTSNVKQQEN